MRYLLIFLLNVLFVSCFSVPRDYLANDTTCHYSNSFFKITKKELTINSNLFKKLKTIKKDTIIVDNDSFKSEFRYSKNEYITNKQTNKQIGIAKYVRYDHHGQIKWVEFKYLNGYKNIFKEFDYNEKGNITKVIDYEKGYNICWAEAIEIVKGVAKKDIKKYEVTGFNISRVDINEFPNEKPKWLISLDGNEEYELKDTKVYWIDGVTGEFLRTTKIITTYD